MLSLTTYPILGPSVVPSRVICINYSAPNKELQEVDLVGIITEKL